MKKTLLCVLACLMGCFFLSSCGGNPIPDPEGIMEPTEALYTGLDQLKPQETQTQASDSDQKEYCIVVDDGFGMKGFVSSYCLSYRAAIGAVTSVSISSNRTCMRASDVAKGTAGAQNSTDTFFQKAVQEDFFQDKSNDIAAVISKLAAQYNEDSDQVIILISDLMIPTEDDCMKAASALQKHIVKPEHTTMGIIGIVGDFRGSIENLPVNPTTGRKRKISDYMVLERDANGNFRHPLYLMFMGNDQAVLSAMEKAMTSLKGSNLLDDTTPYYALYFSEYDIARRETDDIYASFNLGCQEYNLADYPVKNIIKGVENEAGVVSYPSVKAVSEEYQQLLGDIPVVKIYDLERGNTEKNVKIRCTVPYTLTDSTKNGASIIDQFGLVVPAEKLALAKEDYSVSTEIRVLEYKTEGTKTTAGWIVPSVNLARCESATIDDNGEKINVTLSVDTSLLNQDEPLLFQVSVRVSVNPQWAEVCALYDTSWVEALTLNLKEFDSESIQQGKTETSARFTSLTTARTPFLSNLICQGVSDQQTNSVINTISEKTAACVQTTMFGMVVRDVPNRYVMDGEWTDTEDFHGWAFSIEDATGIQAAMK